MWTLDYVKGDTVEQWEKESLFNERAGISGNPLKR